MNGFVFSPSLAGKLAAAFVMAAGFSGAANGAVLAQYTFTGNSMTSSDPELNSTASDLGIGPGITVAYRSTGNPTPALEIPVAATAATEGSAHDDGDYLTITITPAAGYQLNLTDLTADFGATYDTAGRGYGLRTSVNGYGSSVASVTQAANTGAAGTYYPGSISLSGAAFQGLTGSVTLRITVFDSASSASNRNFFDNIVVNGTVTAIPESSSLLAGCLGLTLLVVRRRK